MKFEEILPLMREGKKVRRKNWAVDSFVDPFELRNELTLSSILAEDWELYEEPLPELFTDVVHSRIQRLENTLEGMNGIANIWSAINGLRGDLSKTNENLLQYTAGIRRGSKEDCQHEFSDEILTSMPSKRRCKKCNETFPFETLCMGKFTV